MSMIPVLKGLLPLDYSEYIHKYLILLEFTKNNGDELFPKDIFTVINYFYFLSVYTSAKIICGQEEAMIMVNNEAFGIGNNNYEELGLNERKVYRVPTKLNIKDIQSWSSNHYCKAMVVKNELYCCGDNRHGELGFGNTHIYKKFTKNTYVKDVISVSCGGWHTIIHTKDGIYGCGSNDRGQLGLGKSITYSYKPLKINISNVISVSCGRWHTIVHTIDGLYGFGENNFGQIGTNVYTSIYIPTKINLSYLPNSTSFVCGEMYTIYLSKNEAFVCGTEHKIDCEDDDHDDDHDDDQDGDQDGWKVNFKNIISVSCANSNTLILTKEGLYQMGRDTFSDVNKYSPQKIDIDDIVSFGCGEHYKMILTFDGVYCDKELFDCDKDNYGD